MKQTRSGGARAQLLWAVDAVMAACVVAPLVVGHWRGCWMLLERAGVSSWGSFVGGALGHAAVVVARGWIDHLRPPSDPVAAAATTPFTRVRFFVARRVYTMLFGLACITHWKGGWDVLDAHQHVRMPVAGGCLAALLLTRTMRNSLAPPYVVLADHAPAIFLFPTMFRVQPPENTRHACLYVLDCLFSVLVVGTLVVFVWRGAWVLLDIYLFPDQPESSWASLALGYMIVAVTFALQPVLRRACAHLRGFWRLIVADLYLFFSFLGTVNIWRGFWNVLNEYFLTEHEVLSYWVTHVGCLLLLMLLNCSNSILVRGVFIDAEEEGGKCVAFPTHYLRLFVKLSEQRCPDDAQQLERMLSPNETSVPVIIPASTVIANAISASGNGAGQTYGVSLPAAAAPLPQRTPASLSSSTAISRTLHSSSVSSPAIPSNHLQIATFLNASKSVV